MNITKQVFCFRKPVFQVIYYLPLVISGRKFLVFYWEIEGPFRVFFPRMKYRFTDPKGFAILKLPDDATKVEVIVRSIWRKTKMSWDIKSIELDRVTLSALIQGLNPMFLPGLNIGDLKLNSFKVHPSAPDPSIKSSYLSTNIRPLKFIQEAFCYQD